MNYSLMVRISSHSFGVSWCLARCILSMNTGAGGQGGVGLRLLGIPIVSSSFSRSVITCVFVNYDYRLQNESKWTVLTCRLWAPLTPTDPGGGRAQE